MARNFKTLQKTPMVPVPMMTPGMGGLNTEISDVPGTVDSAWASVLDNAVFDKRGRITLRNGWKEQTVTPITGAPTIYKLHDFVQTDNTVSLIALVIDAGATGIWESTDDGGTWSDITGAISSTSAQWSFANLDNILFACGPGSKVWQYTGSGTFTEIATSPVTRGLVISAFGRLWVPEDGTSDIEYSLLLDGTDWTSVGTGAISLENVWTQGTDIIQALHAFGSTLVVFGKKTVVMYVDGSGSVLGIDPDNMYVVDTIEGTGTEHPDSLVQVGEGDLLYLGPVGIQSLARVIEEKVNPLITVSSNVRSYVNQLREAHVGSVGNIQAVFDSVNEQVIYFFPESNQALIMSTTIRMAGGTYRAASWSGFTSQGAIIERTDESVFWGHDDGTVSKIEGYRDDAGGADTEYFMTYATPWIDFGPDMHNRLKIMKAFTMTVYGRNTLTGTARWAFDYRPLEYSQPVTSLYTPSGAEWGSGEFGDDDFGDGLRMRKERIPAGGQGQHVKFYLTIKSDDVDDKVALQEVGLQAKLGRVT